MAHLIEASGGGELVARVASERNGAYVRELADEPELVSWLDRNGISLAEASAIQPSYDGGRDDKEEEVNPWFALASLGASVTDGAAIGLNLRADAGRGAGWLGLLAGAGGLLVGGSPFYAPHFDEQVRYTELTMATVNVGIGLTAMWLGVRTLLRDRNEAPPREPGQPPASATLTLAPMAGLVNGVALQGEF
jgi:hypothetical protein